MNKAIFILSSLWLNASLAATAVPQQLNIDGFGSCLEQAHTLTSPSDLEPLVTRYHFASDDGILIFLAIQPGKFIPLISAVLQKPALHRWSGNFASQEKDFAHHLLKGVAEWTPAKLYAEALVVCQDEPFCATLVAHNVLRTLGHPDEAVFHDPKSAAVEDRNPSWFQEARSDWTSKVAALQTRLMPLSRDGSGNRWDQWYHFFGIAAFGIHEAAVGKEPGTINSAAAINQLLKPWLAGAPEEPVQARLDQDAAEVMRRYLHGNKRLDGQDCTLRATYVVK